MRLGKFMNPMRTVMRMNDNSFGLSAWTKEEAVEYCEEKLFKVAIKVEDIACIVHNGNKIRARKIRIVEEMSE